MLLAVCELRMGVFVPISQSKPGCEAARGLLQLADLSGVVGKQQRTWKMETEEYRYVKPLNRVRLVPKCSLERVCVSSLCPANFVTCVAPL